MPTYTVVVTRRPGGVGARENLNDVCPLEGDDRRRRTPRGSGRRTPRGARPRGSIGLRFAVDAGGDLMRAGFFATLRDRPLGEDRRLFFLDAVGSGLERGARLGAPVDSRGRVADEILFRKIALALVTQTPSAGGLKQRPIRTS